jgi:hypothetical protein
VIGTKESSQSTNRYRAIVTVLCLVFAARRCRSTSGRVRWSNRPSRWTDRGISKHGEPRSPTPVRTGPSTGTMAFVAIRQLSPARLPVG